MMTFRMRRIWYNPYEHSMISWTPALQHGRTHMGILRPLDCMVRPLVAFHIILWFINLVTCAAAGREAILPENSLVM